MTKLTNDLDVLRTTIGRTAESTEKLRAEHCNRLADALDLPANFTDGDALPPLWHFALHASSAPTARLGPDGHAERGGFLPPVALPRRMWAGSRIMFLDDIRLGEVIDKRSTIAAVDAKEGRSGPLRFVTISHELSVDGDVRMTEEQDLVFRDAPDPNAAPPTPKAPPTGPEVEEIVVPSEVLLFRYSALTFNSHRIHYDLAYVRKTEGYRGLLVHGPLTATLLAGLAVRHTKRRLATFTFRGLAPLIGGEAITLAGTASDDGMDLWAASEHSGVAMTASASFDSRPS